MILKKIEEKEYKEYALKNEYISIYQLPEWGKLKEKTGWISHTLGLFDEKKLMGVTLLLEKKTPIRMSLFYAPRGFLLDIDNYDLLKEFTKLISEYVKKNHGFMLKVDPNKIYALYDKEGENKKVIAYETFQHFCKLKYKHLGFTKNFESLQPRFLCRIPLEDTFEKTLSTFQKSTRKNIEKTNKMGVRVRKIDETEIDLFVSLLEQTGHLKNFIVRPASYYKRMYELMKENITLYITYIDTNLYYTHINNEIKRLEKEKEEIDKKSKAFHVGNKLLTAKKQNEEQRIRLEKELITAQKMRSSNEKINIGALMSIFIGEEGITFMSGTTNQYKSFNPKYAFYSEHIKECIKEGKRYCNFYGISGDINPNNPYYSIYEIKKGFNPEIVELMGEFDLITNRIGYYLYHIALKGYKIIKKIRK